MKVKLIFFILNLVLLNTIFIPQTFAQHEDGTGIPGSTDGQVSKYYINLPDFKSSNPWPVSEEKTSSDNIKKYASNNDPHIEIIADNKDKAEAKVFSLIHGIGIFDRAAIVNLINNKKDEDIINQLFPSGSTDISKQTEKYILIHLDYDDHTDLDTLLPGDDPSLFLAGAGAKKLNNNNFLSTTYDNYSKLLTLNNSNFSFISEDQKNNLSKNGKINSGACYTIKPKGTSNTCTDTVASGCSLGSANTTFFLYGITCTNLNTLFKDKDSEATVNPNTTSKTTAPLRDKIEVQIQVPFGKVKNGINIAEYINAIYEYLIGFALVLAGIMLSLGGFQYITGKTSEAKKSIKNALLGFILLATSYTLLKVINPNVLELKDISGSITEVARETFDLPSDLGGPTSPEGGSAEVAAVSKNISPISNKLVGCSAYQPPVASSVGLEKSNPWKLDCIDLTTDTTRITDEATMKKYALQYQNNPANSNEHMVYYIASSGLTWGYLFQSTPKLSWNTVNKYYRIYDETKKETVSLHPTNNAIWGKSSLETTGSRGVCIDEKSYAISNSSTQKKWTSTTQCSYQDLVTAKWRSYYKKDDGSYSLNKTGSGRSAGYVFQIPYYKQSCVSN